MKSTQSQNKSTPFKKKTKVIIIALAVYFLMILIFPLLAGHQLYYKNSRGNIAMQDGNIALGEITKDCGGVNQSFTPTIERLTKISVIWATYARANTGTVYVELYRESDLKQIAVQTLDISVIKNGEKTELEFDEPLTDYCGEPLMLRLSSPDCVAGSSISPMINTEETNDLGSLVYQGQRVEGVLCFSAEGEDVLWIGQNYWLLTLSVGAGLLIIGTILIFLAYKGKRLLFINYILELKNYRFLIRKLVSRDFKIKYKRSVLGVLWSLLNPLLTTLVQYIVFSNVFRFEIANYPVYLLSGVVLFSFFSESCAMMLTSITGNAGLITKVYMPKYIYPLTRTMSSLINLLLAFIPLILVTVVSGLIPTIAYFLLPIPLIFIAVFSLGMGLLLSSLMVFFRDTQFLWSVISMAWMYLTPLFYPASILPDSVRWILDYNPLCYFITMVRTIMIDGISPEPIMYVQGFALAIGMLLIGGFVFKKTQNKFVLHI